MSLSSLADSNLFLAIKLVLIKHNATNWKPFLAAAVHVTLGLSVMRLGDLSIVELHD